MAIFWDEFVKMHKDEANAELDRVASYLINSFGVTASPPSTIPPSPCLPLPSPPSSSSLPHPESDLTAAHDTDSLCAIDLLPSDQTPPLPLPLPLGPHDAATSSSSSSSSSSRSGEVADVVEDVPRVTLLLTATTMRPLYQSIALSSKNEEIRNSCQANIVMCGDTTSSLTMEEEVAQAESTFRTLFPGSIFLPPKTMEKEEEE